MTEKCALFLVVFFEEPVSGRLPVKLWIKDLGKNDRGTIGKDLLFLQYNWPIGMPYARYLGSALWEMRSTITNAIARLIFVVRNDKIIVLHAFIKKTQKTPPSEIAIALKRLKSIK